MCGLDGWSLATVAVQTFTRPRIAFEARPEAFDPQHQVTSARAVLEVARAPAVDGAPTGRFCRFGEGSFVQSAQAAPGRPGQGQRPAGRGRRDPPRGLGLEPSRGRDEDHARLGGNFRTFRSLSERTRRMWRCRMDRGAASGDETDARPDRHSDQPGGFRYLLANGLPVDWFAQGPPPRSRTSS